MLKITSLRNELKEAGLLERREGVTWMKLAFLFSTFAALTVAHVLLPFWASALLIPVTALFAASCAMMAHEGGHRGLSANKGRNDLMLFSMMTAFGGVSGNYWRFKHNVQHHVHTNIEFDDPDIDVWPMASTARAYRESNPFRQWFQRNFQGYMFWPLTFLLVFSMRVAGVSHLRQRIKDKGLGDADNRKDLLSLAIHVGAWWVAPILAFGWMGLLFHVALWMNIGFFLAAVFSPAHMALPVLTDHDDKWRLQFETTRNFIMPKWLSFFFIGLDYQLEHHLFMRAPHQNMAKIAEHTRRWAAERDLPYYVVDYGKSLLDVTHYMHHAWRLEPVGQHTQDQWTLRRSEVDLTAQANQKAPEAPVAYAA